MDDMMEYNYISGKVFTQRNQRCDANHNVASHSWMEMENARGGCACVEGKGQGEARAMPLEEGTRKLKGDVIV